MKKKTIEKIPFFGKKKIHRLGDCFIIDGKWIDGKTNNINARICLREHEYANYIEGVGWNTKCLESWWKYSDDQFKVELELSKKEKKELSDFYKKTERMIGDGKKQNQTNRSTKLKKGSIVKNQKSVMKNECRRSKRNRKKSDRLQKA